MLKFKTVFIILLLFSFHSQAKDPMVEKLARAKLPPLTEPDIHIHTLPNGVKVYYLQDAELPVLKMTSYLEMGNIYETKETRGHAGYFMSAWRSGGTKTMKPSKVDEEIEFVSAKLSAGAGADLSTFQVTCLQKDVKKVLDIYFDLFFNPAFDNERVELIRKNVLSAIKRRNEKPLDIVGREFLQSLFGEDTPYSWKSTAETINKVSQESLQKFYDDNVAANRTLIAATSPLSFHEFLELLDPYLKNWTKKRPLPQLPKAVKKEWQASIEFIHKPGNQSSVMVGHFGEKRFNKDKFKIVVADEILGGTTFGSRLGNRIRTDLGLAYSIRSHFGFDRDYGAFRIMTQTKSESTVRTIQEIQSILKDLVAGVNLTQQELDDAKERIINRLIFEYDIPFNVVAMRLTYDYRGYPAKYLTVYQKEIEKVTLADVKEVMPQYIFPDKLKIMVVGDKTKIKDLDQLKGWVERPLDSE